MACLLLEDGSVYYGKSAGYQGDAIGEVVFNTSMTGYQELLSDPSYCGQMVVMTYPLIGNIGINERDLESKGIQVAAFIIGEICETPSHYMSSKTLSEYLTENGVVCLSGMDTRSLTRRIREHGTLRGMILQGEPTEEAMEKIKAFNNIRPVDKVTIQDIIRDPDFPGGPRVAVMDFGAKQSILRKLRAHGCALTVYPAHTTAAEILRDGCDGVLLTNGPGDPKDNGQIIEEVGKLIHAKPTMGICLGFQLMALASGADTKKMHYGHRGSNHPVKDVRTGKVFITSQNHGYAMVGDSLPKSLAITHLNWNDQTIEGVRSRNKPFFGVQFHPEANPGPTDTRYLFDDFIQYMKKGGF